MGLINRVAVSNMLNHHGDSQRADWIPRIRYECLDLRGQSTAINLTNGGGKTTLAEAVIGALSRDHRLISNSKKKFSPKQSGVWSHVQVELIRPITNVGQVDFLTNEGNRINGEHWVFGMYGYRNDQSVNYYYFKGCLEDLPVGFAEDNRRRLQTNERFTQNRKNMQGFVMSPSEDEWSNVLALKVNLPKQTVKQLADFQKRGGQDKSALLYEIRTRPGQTYGEAFFYKILAPAVMEGVMDREGEEGEVKLEDTIERAVYSTVKAKQDTAAKRREVNGLEVAVNRLAGAMTEAESVTKLRKEYEAKLVEARASVKILSHLVHDRYLPGIPWEGDIDERLREVMRYLVLEPGKRDLRIVDKGLAKLIGKSVKELTEAAESSGTPCDEIMQGVVLPYAHDDGNQKRLRTFTVERGLNLLKSTKLLSGSERESAIELLEDARDSFLDKADSNPFRRDIEQASLDLDQLKINEVDLTLKQEELHKEQKKLLSLQQRMETNEGYYKSLLESGYFSEEELKAPAKTALTVKKVSEEVRLARSNFDRLDSFLCELKPQWDRFCDQFSSADSPARVKQNLLEEKESINVKHNEVRKQLRDMRGEREKCKIGQVMHERKIAEEERMQSELSRLEPKFEAFKQTFGNISSEGHEQTLRRELKHVIQQVSKLDGDVARLREELDIVDRYQAEISQEALPAAWLKDIVFKRNELTIALQQHQEEMEDLSQQREALEKERIAANEATRRAHRTLHDHNISYTPLHAAIDGMMLDDRRRKDVLGAFSALLFAPVMASENEARDAAIIFEEEGVQLPVFVTEYLEIYCREGVITKGAEDALLIGAVAGILTRAVQCLLDPELVEREKRALEEKVNLEKARIEEIELSLVDLSEDNERVQLARRAGRALQDDVPRRYDECNTKLTTERQRQDKLEELTRAENLEVIRDAERYERLGGKAKQKELATAISTTKTVIEQLAEVITRSDGLIEKLEAREIELNDRLQTMLPDGLLTMLSDATRFFEKDGPNFYVNREKRLAALKSDEEASQAREQYHMAFEGAQNYLDALGSDIQGGGLERRLGEIATEQEALKAKAVDARKGIDRLTLALPMLERAMEALDKAAIQAIKRFRHVVALEDDVGTVENVDVSGSFILGLCNDIQGALEQVKDPNVVKGLAEQVANELEEIDIERKALDLSRVKKELIRHENQFLSTIRNIADNPDGLRPVEQHVLKQVATVSAIPQVLTLYEGLLEQFRDMKEQLEQLERSEREARQGVTTRLSHLVEFASTDLHILQQVVGSKRGKHTSYFNVKAEVLPNDGIKALMDSILAEVDVMEEQRRDRERLGLKAGEEEHRETLRAMICSKLYKTIFQNPEITYVNESIRAAGNANEFNENLSEGQKAALSLMWTIRLAEFFIEREAKRLSSRRSQLKAQEQSVNIMIIDGLFSNLSNKELIDSSMAGIESTRGRFQLIGLIHNPHYENDYDKFPVYILGKNLDNGRRGPSSKSWVSFDRISEEEGTLRTAQIRRIPAETV